MTAMYGRASEQSRISESNSAVSNCIKERYFTALDGDGLPYRIGISVWGSNKCDRSDQKI